MELIKKWLAGQRNFYVGAVLYGQFGKDDRLKKYFEGPPDPLKQKKLEAELQAMLLKPAAALVAPKLKVEADEMPVTGDCVLDALRNDWMPKYQRMNYLRHQLDTYEGNSPEVIAKRKPIAFEILDLEQQCMKIWIQRDYYLDHGRIRPEAPIGDPLPEDPVELGKMVENLKKNIRRNAQLLKKNPGNPDYAMRVKEYQAKLDRITQSNDNGK